MLLLWILPTRHLTSRLLPRIIVFLADPSWLLLRTSMMLQLVGVMMLRLPWSDLRDPLERQDILELLEKLELLDPEELLDLLAYHLPVLLEPLVTP